MPTNEQVPSTYNSFICSLAALVLTGALVLVGCDSNDPAPDEPEIEEIAIYPRSASIEVGEQVDFSVVALTASGDTVPEADLDLRWWSTDPEVFTVEGGGTATGEAPGEAFCKVELESDDAAGAALHFKAAKIPIGLDSARVTVLF